MMHISVLVPRGAVALSCIEGTLTLFGKVNDLLAEQGKAPRFAVQLVGIDNTPQIYDGCFTVRPDVAIGQVNATNLIVIPAINGDKAEVIAANAAFLPWIIACHKSGAEVASLCVGAFLLAETGLLQGKQCAMHWTAAADFKRMFSGGFGGRCHYYRPVRHLFQRRGIVILEPAALPGRKIYRPPHGHPGIQIL